jgi:type I restriction enzyme, R subunit
MFGDLSEFFRNENELRAIWSRSDTRKALLERLVEKGYGGAQLANLRRMIDADDSDLFDVLAYIAFGLASIKRQERVSEHKSRNLSQYDYKQQAFLDFVLSQ